jgi:hypothetical protein
VADNTCPRCGSPVSPTAKECGVCRMALNPAPGPGGAPAGVAGPPPGATPGGPPPGAGGPPPGVGGPPAGAMKLASSPLMKPKFLALGTGLTWALVTGLPGLVNAFTEYGIGESGAAKAFLFVLMLPTILVAAVVAVGQWFIANIPVPVFGEQWRTACAVLMPISVFAAVYGLIELMTILAL